MKKLRLSAKAKLYRLIRSEAVRAFALGVVQGFTMCL